jgi:PKD repeat protein
LASVLAVLLATFTMALATAANAALPNTSNPTLHLNRTIRTTPFAGSSVSLKDNEGSAYVPSDNSLWIADDDGRQIAEVNATTGALRRSFGRTALEAVRQLGGSTPAGPNRRDFESLAYDEANDILYLFAGNCCTSGALPAVYRLTRQSGILQLDSFQPLPSSSDFTAADWNPGDGKLYVSAGKDFRTYTYATNTIGTSAFAVPNLSGILGMGFSSDGADLFVVRGSTLLSRVNWAARSLVPGWTLNLAPFGMRDTRSVELIGDQFFIGDGYDGRSTSDPLRDAVFVMDVAGSTPSPTAPTASFTATPTSGQAPLTVAFNDTSTGGPTSWLWDFGDGQSSTTRNPSHEYTAIGTYTATLTASNATGSTSASRQISVSATPPPPPPPPPPGDNLIANAGFEENTAGWDNNGNAGVSLARVAGGHTGSWSAKLTNTSSAALTNTLNDAPNRVATSSAGTYTGSIWVRSDTAGAKLYLRIREYAGSTKLGEKLVLVNLTTSWQQVSGTLVPTSPGTSTIDFATAVYSAPAGSSYYADDASLTFS